MVLSQTAVNQLFGSPWSRLLFEDFNMGPLLDNVVKQVTAEGAKHVIYPPKPRIFEAFRTTGPNIINVIFLVQDPYHDGSATGIALANKLKEGDKMSPSLSVFKKEWQEDTGGVISFDPSLKRYADQGIMFLNTALTVREGEPKSHADLWEEWTSTFVSKYSNYNRACLWVLMGKHAQSYQPHIVGGHVLKTVHPAAEVYSGGKSGFFGSKPFYKINLQLAKTGQKIIKW